MIVTLVAAAASLASQTPDQTAPVPSPCASAQHRAFDFWVGKWDVTAYKGGPVLAHSLIESLYGGCAIRENWMPLKGTAGGSLSNFEGGRWHQTWVDASGVRVLFEGGYEGDAMVLTGMWPAVTEDGKDGLVRMTYTRQPGNLVRQKGDVSTDQGKTWAPLFDFLYSPTKGE